MARGKYVVYTKDKNVMGGHWVEVGTWDEDQVGNIVGFMCMDHDRVMIAKVEVEDGLEE